MSLLRRELSKALGSTDHLVWIGGGGCSWGFEYARHYFAT